MLLDDVEKLAADWSVNVANYLDLADFARSVDPFWAKCDTLCTQTLEGAFGLEVPLNMKNDDSNSPGSVPNHSKPPTFSSSINPEIQNNESFTQGTNEFTRLRDAHPFAYPQGPPIALVRLVARYQGRRLDKSCQLSNWAAPLSKLQVQCKYPVLCILMINLPFLYYLLMVF